MWILPSLLLACAPLVAEPVPHHYIVLEVDRAGRAAPVFHAVVSLERDDAAMGVQSDGPRDIASDAAPIDYSLLDARGDVVRSGRVDVPVLLRAEPGPFGLEPRIVESPSRSFVIRVPVVPRGTLVLEPAGPGEARRPLLSGQTRVDLDSLASARLPLSGFRVPSTARATLTGSPSNRLDLLIMGDGYTAAQSGKFDTDASNLLATFLSISPYSTYSAYVNTAKLFTASAQSGADHPPYCPGGGASCCSDPDAANDGLAGTYVNTAFDATFCTSNIHRLLTTNASKVLAAAAATPNWDKIMVVVNDTTYGGAGGAISTVSTNSFAVEVAQHEFGHSFTLLADEYTSAYPGYPSCNDITSSPPCEPNVTNQTSRASIKWTAWISGATPVPTPDNATYDTVVGLFQGARYQTSGYYRPKRSCLMNSLGVPFCEICKQAYVLRLYKGGWGVPSSGIRTIEPGSASPSATNLTYTLPGVSQVFSVGLLQPQSGLQVSWWVNGVQQAGQTGASFSFSPASAGNYAVEVRAKDASSLVSSTQAISEMESRRTWLVTVKKAGGCCTAGDANGSGGVDVFDVVLLSSHIVGNQPAEVSPMLAPAALMNLNPGTGALVDVFDLVLLQNFVVGNVSQLPQ